MSNKPIKVPRDVEADIRATLHVFGIDPRPDLVQMLGEDVVKHCRKVANAMLDEALNSGNGTYRP